MRVRFAPSPTGFLHIGGLRTALYNYLIAKKNNGSFILRIEDTDRSRLVENATEKLIESMNWAGIATNEGVMLKNNKITQIGEYGPYIQSERLDIYSKKIKKLLDEDNAYYCFCDKERLEKLREENEKAGRMSGYDRHCRSLSKDIVNEYLKEEKSYVIRLKVPENVDITFNDIIRGEISINTNEVDDQVLIKSDGYPTYHFAVVVDDTDMKISHIIRGEEWITSVPKHILLYKALGYELPTYAHVPVVLAADKKKLSKRRGDAFVEDFSEKGFLPEALINYIALVGFSPEDGSEIMNIDELIEKFDLLRVSKSPGVFDVEKLKWMNSKYIDEYDTDKLLCLCKPYMLEAGYNIDIYSDMELKSIVELCKEPMQVISDIVEQSKIFFVKPDLEQDAAEFLQKEHIQTLRNNLIDKINNIEDYNEQNIKAMLKEISNEQGIKGKDLFMGTRVIITGMMHGRDLNKTLEILGKERSIDYINIIHNK